MRVAGEVARGGKPRSLAAVTGAAKAAAAAAEAAAVAAEAAAAEAARVKAAQVALRVTLRRARPQDAERVWEWCFHGELRAVMQSARVVLYREFLRWFEGRLRDRQMAVWIIEDAGASVGVAVIDRHDKQGLPRLALSLGKRVRGRGIGRRALELVCEQWQRPVVVEVSADNVAGMRCLEAAGFERTGEAAAGGPVVRCMYLWSP